MVWFWYRDKFIEKMRNGVVLYLKPSKNKYAKEKKQVRLNRKLETKNIYTHTKK